MTEMLIGIGLLAFGIYYGWWAYFDKPKKEESTILSKVADINDKIIPIALIVSGVILIFNHI